MEFWLGRETLSHLQQPKLEQKVAELFERFRDSVYHYVIGIVSNPAEAEEVTQEAFLRLYCCLLKGVAIDNCRAWIFRVAHNLAIDFHRKSGPGEPMDSAIWDDACAHNPDPRPDPEQDLLNHERQQQFRAAVSRLSPQERHCLDLRAEGLRYREIAEVLGLPLSAVENSMERIVKKIRKQIYEQPSV
ncbi:MAG: sigma-70 family RNA polymerase sigma factor [Acidobacteria bacterium]|nr:sigma-70 family RNA polymerase sigma factor [Acidobacteriota bacterium]MCI0625337.1 sigma-70 family RNA polymerase sigma factor [Acidobacteriota bacterium]MCI0721042.1 sigma-70 family RNA polymerase sigma factor [Acidobacteriota bacterium]